jgi:hypothetical protein
MTRGEGYEAGDTPASRLKAPPANMVSPQTQANLADTGRAVGRSVSRSAAKLAATKPVTETFGFVITEKSRWRPGVEVDITVRVRSEAELEVARTEIKAMGVRAFAALERAEEAAAADGTDA